MPRRDAVLCGVLSHESSHQKMQRELGDFLSQHSGVCNPSSFRCLSASTTCHAIWRIVFSFFHPIFYSILHSCVRSVKKVQWILYARDSSWAPTRGVMIPRLESIPEDFHHFSEIYDSNSNSCKKRFLYCTGIDSGYWNWLKNLIFIMVMIPIPIPIPEKNGIITPVMVIERMWSSVHYNRQPLLGIDVHI